MTKRNASLSDKYKRWPSIRLYDNLGVPYIIASGWEGPIWTGHCMILDPKDHYGDAQNFHELVHWLTASEKMRSLPDYGIGRNINANDGITFATSTTDFVYDDSAIGQNCKEGWGEPLVPISQRTANEKIACEALAVYEPVCGVWGWDEISASINDAADDYAGMKGLILTEATAKRVWRKVVSQLDSRVTEAMVVRYFAALAEERS